jgi:hypothetical protein
MGASQTFDGNLHGFFTPCTLSSDHDICDVDARVPPIRNLCNAEPGQHLYETFTTLLHRPYGGSGAMDLKMKRKKETREMN